MTELRWSGILLVEQVPTNDGRAIDAGAVTFDRELPLPLMDRRTGADREGRIGTIDKLARVGLYIMGGGRWFGEELPVGTTLCVGGDLGGITYEYIDFGGERICRINWPAPIYAAAVPDEGQSCWPEAIITITEASE